MKLNEIIGEEISLEECEVIWCDEAGNEILDESAIRQFKRVGAKLIKKFRCTSGPKTGKMVASPQACGMRKDPAKVRRGRKVMRTKGAIIKRKSAIAKKKSSSKIVARLNARIRGDKPKGSNMGSRKPVMKRL